MCVVASDSSIHSMALQAWTRMSQLQKKEIGTKLKWIFTDIQSENKERKS